MEKIKDKVRGENGNVTVVALMILVILTLIGISASRTSSTDIIAARNQIPYKQDFYIAEGGQNKEAAKIGRGDYYVNNMDEPGITLDVATGEISAGNSYDYNVSYEGHYPPPAGYSILHFSRYDYSVTTKGGESKVTINARYYTIRPKTE
jgi:hypothetical protein